MQGFETMLWLRNGFGFAGVWSVREQNQLLAVCFGLLAILLLQPRVATGSFKSPHGLRVKHKLIMLDRHRSGMERPHAITDPLSG